MDGDQAALVLCLCISAVLVEQRHLQAAEVGGLWIEEQFAGYSDAEHDSLFKCHCNQCPAVSAVTLWRSQ